jgi:hypothetical protein
MPDKAKKFGQLIAKCWADEEFKKKFKADPAAVIKEHGIDLPAGIKLHVHETTEKEAHIVIPPKPSKEMADAQLDKVAGGGGSSNTAGTIGCACIVTAGTAYSH